jgi:AcrR family transcriptional regulator
MGSTTALGSATRRRTRQAILSAAASAFARDRKATLPDIADAASVGRTTLHRYFPERQMLIDATIDDSISVIQRSTADAALGDGPPREALRRAVAAMVAVGDRLVFLFGDPRVLEKYRPAQPQVTVVDPVLDLIRRGQAESLFDSELSAEWIQHVLWSLVYRAWQDADAGLLPRHGVTETVIRTLEKGIYA